MKDILFFRIQSDTLRREKKNFPTAFPGIVEIWTPTALQVKPKGLGWFPFGVWWLFHHTYIFKSRAYKVYLIRVAGVVVHRSCLFPHFFRFPFMNADDLQIGDIWTAESERRKGLSELIINQIINDCNNKTIWFLCEAENRASESLARGAGMELYGVGRRTSLFGIGVLGRFVIRSY